MGPGGAIWWLSTWPPMAMRREKGTWEEISGPEDWDEPPLDSYIPVPNRGWGR